MGKMWPSHLATCKIAWNRYWYFSSVWLTEEVYWYFSSLWLTEEVYWDLCSVRKVLWRRRCWSPFFSIVSPGLVVVKLRFVLIILHYPSAVGDHKSFTVRAVWRTFFSWRQKKNDCFSARVFAYRSFCCLPSFFVLCLLRKWQRFHFVVTSVVCLMRFICALRSTTVEIPEWNGKKKRRYFCFVFSFFVYIASWL